MSESNYTQRFKHLVKINTISQEKYYPLSIEQESLWLDNALLNEQVKDALVLTGSFLISGEVKYDTLKKTFLILLLKYPSLSSNYKLIDDILISLKQDVCQKQNLYGKEIDLSSMAKSEQNSYIKQSFKNIIDIEKKVIDFILFKLAEESYHYVIYVHQIAVDTTGLLNLVNDFFTLYEGVDKGDLDLKMIKPIKRDANTVLSRREKIVNNTQAIQYWKKEFTDIRMVQETLHPIKDRLYGELLIEKIDGNRYQKLKLFSQKYKVSIFVILMALYQLLLHKLSQETKVSVFTGLSTRDEITENEIGYFINSLPVISTLHEEENFLEFLFNVQNTIKNISDIRDYPFSEVNNLFSYDRSLPAHPLLRFSTAYTKYTPFSKEFPKSRFTYCPVSTLGNPGADISFVFVESDSEVSLEFQYNQEIFDSETAKGMLSRFQNFLTVVLEQPDIKVQEIRLLSDEEENEQLVYFNDTVFEYDKSKTLHQLFEEQVEKTPENIAVIFEKEQLTYKALNQRANQLAHVLVEEGVKADDLVAICVDRSVEMIIGLLGILKAGAAYMPIDIKSPSKRIQFMLQDANAKILLTQSTVTKDLSQIKSICIKNKVFDDYPDTNSCNPVQSNMLAYVMYTSGTTGEPKGVMVEHKSVVNTIIWFINTFELKTKTQVLCLTDYTFDPSVEDIFGSLASGATLHLVPDSFILQKELVREYILKNSINIINFVPSILHELLKSNDLLTSIRYVISGAEILPENVKQDILDKGYMLYNNYGPTEITVDALSEKCSMKRVTLGLPINNTQVYIVDKNNALVPKGAKGELCIAGDGLARGYLNRPALTKEKFVNNPFVQNTKMYKTGDLVKYTNDGNIEYLGRIDEQVKIRGYRIELGEIEQQILSIARIKQSVVIVKKNTLGEQVLVSYLVTEDNKEIDIAMIKLELAKYLPEFMIPKSITRLSSMPLTANGKIDKNALSELEIAINTSQKYIAPRNEIEENLAKIFLKVLKIEKIGVHDSFFELGGHSLLAVKLIGEINKSFNKSLALVVLFKAASIATLAPIVVDNNCTRDILVPIQTKGDKVPIFVLPSVGGTSIVYQHLSNALGKDQPVYGLDTVESSIDGSPRDGFKKMAKDNVIAMKTIQPKGPYRLIGFCFGGLMAYEMAILLKGEIDNIILLNATSSTKDKSLLEHLKVFARLWIYKFKMMLLRFKGISSLSFIHPFIDRYAQTSMTRYNTICFDWYKADPYNERLNVGLFCIKDRKLKKKSEYKEEYSWGSLLENDATIELLESTHAGLLHEVNAENLSRVINKYYESLKKNS